MSINNRLFDFSVTFIVLLVLFTPAIKFFIFSGIVNLIILAILTFLAALSIIKDYKISTNNFIIGLIYILFILAIFFSGLMSTANIDVKILSKYLSIVILISTIVILFKHININLFIKLTIITSTLLVFLNIINVIRPSGAGELSYLILSLQVTIGVSALLGRSFFSTNYKVFYCVLLLINLFGVLSQAGRSSVLACLLLIIMTFILFSIVHFKNNRILIGALWVFIVSISIYVFNYLLEYVFNDYFIYKMESLLSGGGDTRFSTYFEAVNIIKDAPLGLGVNGYLNQLGFYPHNIFLEIGLNIGILGVLFFLGIFLSFVFLYLKKIYNGKVVIADDLSLFLMALSLFISWNTSNSLSSSYPLFLCLLLSTLSSVKRKNEVI